MVNGYGTMIFKIPSVDPLPPYSRCIIAIYRFLLKRGEKVIRCEQVMYNGECILPNMYDIEITNNSSNDTKYSSTIRLFPTEAEDWNNWR